MLPQDFDDGEAFAESVQDVDQHVLENRCFDQVPHGIDDLLVDIAVSRLIDDGLDSEHRSLSGAQNRGVVEIPFLHLFGERQVFARLSLDRIAQDAGEPGRGETGRNRVAPDRANTGQGRRGFFPQQLGRGDGTAGGIYDLIPVHHKPPECPGLIPPWRGKSSSSSSGGPPLWPA